MVQITEIQELLQSFVTNTLDLRGAILTSTEGLCLASAFVDVDRDKNKEAAITANFLALIKQFKKDL